ncbi:MAG: error-prone DNA polymerase [Planctomycetota bacterium]
MPRYAELHCRSNFSFLQAASHPDELVETAADLGYQAIAITDQESVAGVVRGHGTAKQRGIQYIVGTVVHPHDAPPMVLWPTNRVAYGNMCRLISRGRLRAEKGHCELRFADIAEHAGGILAGLIPDRKRIAPQQSHPAQAAAGQPSLRQFLQGPFQDAFGDRAYLLAQLHHGVDDRAHAQQLGRLAIDTHIPLVAAGDVRYHIAHRMRAHDCLVAIREGVTIDHAQAKRHANASRHLRRIDEIAALYRDIPDAVDRTIEVAARCQFSLDELRYEYPEEMAPPGMTLIEHLKRLTWEGARQRWPRGVPDRVVDILRHELEIIRDKRYEAYFLTVWDMVRFARQRGILCQGRGSAANSTVCYCLGITSVDPSQTDLLFERFVSRERDEAPDIDVDFEHQRREEVLQYLYEKYGRDRAGMTAVVTTYRIRSAIRDIGKALGVSPDVIDTIAKLGGAEDGFDFDQRCAAGGLDPNTPLGGHFIEMVSTITGFPRHLSQHTGGMVMTAGKLCDLCPVENASMPGRTVIQWNKDDLDELGILKVDVLALGMLSAIRRCFDFVRRHYGQHMTLSNLPPGDTDTYDMICRADTMGVFQIESRAQMNMLPRLRPRCYYDLVIEVAIVRPGPIQGDMVHPYLKARQNPEAVVYPNDEIRRVLQKTLGVPIFQEQAMRLAVVAAGFTPGEADQLRRAMAAWRRKGVIEKFRVKLLRGMHEKGLTGKFAEQVFHQIRGFGEYGFPESHAASFALLVYASCYLKCHFPAAFCAAILNSQPMGFYAPAQLVADARQHNVRVHPADVNHSDWDCTLETETNHGVDPTLRLGLRTIRGLPEEVGRGIATHRDAHGRFTDVDDLAMRCGLGRSTLTILADADALASISGDRRAAVWDSLDRDDTVGSRPLLECLDDPTKTPDSLRPMSPADEVESDYATTGLSLRAHPISFVREALDAVGCIRADALPGLRNGRYVRVAGLVLLRQRPETAKGINFVTLEDESGSMNLVIFPPTWKRFYRVARTTNSWLVDGKLENREGIIHIVVGNIEDLADYAPDQPQVNLPRRDFR